MLVGLIVFSNRNVSFEFYALETSVSAILCTSNRKHEHNYILNLSNPKPGHTRAGRAGRRTAARWAAGPRRGGARRGAVERDGIGECARTRAGRCAQEKTVHLARKPYVKRTKNTTFG